MRKATPCPPGHVLGPNKGTPLRLWNIFGLGPFTVWAGAQDRLPDWARMMLGVSGVVVIATNSLAHGWARNPETSPLPLVCEDVRDFQAGQRTRLVADVALLGPAMIGAAAMGRNNELTRTTLMFLGAMTSLYNWNYLGR